MNALDIQVGEEYAFRGGHPYWSAKRWDILGMRGKVLNIARRSYPERGYDVEMEVLGIPPGYPGKIRLGDVLYLEPRFIWCPWSEENQRWHEREERRNSNDAIIARVNEALALLGLHEARYLHIPQGSDKDWNLVEVTISGAELLKLEARAKELMAGIGQVEKRLVP